MVIETDHMLMRPPENVATPDRPVGFGFYYMTGTDPKLKPVVQKFLADGIDVTTVDAVGPSPIIIHKPMLERVARPWWDLSQRMQHDRDAQVIFGWVLEMWGYNRARCAEHTLYSPLRRATPADASPYAPCDRAWQWRHGTWASVTR